MGFLRHALLGGAITWTMRRKCSRKETLPASIITEGMLLALYLYVSRSIRESIWQVDNTADMIGIGTLSEKHERTAAGTNDVHIGRNSLLDTDVRCYMQTT